MIVFYINAAQNARATPMEEELISVCKMLRDAEDNKKKEIEKKLDKVCYKFASTVNKRDPVEQYARIRALLKAGVQE